IKIIIKRAMTGMMGDLKEVMEEDGGIEVDMEDEAEVEEEVSFLVEHVIHVDHLTTIGVNACRISHVHLAERDIVMRSVWTCMSISVSSTSKRTKVQEWLGSNAW
ncbi:hypothetical protein KI387_032946, partial [Taxus chinensis]